MKLLGSLIKHWLGGDQTFNKADRGSYACIYGSKINGDIDQQQPMTNDIPTLRTDLNLDTRDNFKRSHLEMQQMVWFVDEQQNWVSKVLKRIYKFDQNQNLAFYVFRLML